MGFDRLPSVGHLPYRAHRWSGMDARDVDYVPSVVSFLTVWVNHRQPADGSGVSPSEATASIRIIENRVAVAVN